MAFFISHSNNYFLLKGGFYLMNTFIFHHFDADGYCAAAVLKALLSFESHPYHAENIEMIFQSVEHSKDMDVSEVKSGDRMFIVDYSFTRTNDIENVIRLMDEGVDIIWIDHHDSSNRLIKEHSELEELAKKGFVYTKDPKYAGCYLTYIYMLYIWNKLSSSMSIICPSKESALEGLNKPYVPRVVELVSDYDTWRQELSESTNFVMGCNITGLNNAFLKYNGEDVYPFFIYIMKDLRSVSSRWLEMNKDCVWYRAVYKEISKSDINDINLAWKIIPLGDQQLSYLINKGRTVSEIDKVRNEQLIANSSFEAGIKIDMKDYKRVAKILCVNARGNSEVFGDKFEEYDAVSIFTFDGEQYKYSMYSKKNNGLNCEIVATCFFKAFGMNGGGHEHAAGWSSRYPVFYKDTLTELYDDGYTVVKDNQNIIRETRGTRTIKD